MSRWLQPGPDTQPESSPKAATTRHWSPSRLAAVAADEIAVLDGGRQISFSFEELLLRHGGNSPGGVAHAYKVLERALAQLDPSGPVERREILIETAFGGPGARDAFELVTAAVSEGRYAVAPSLARPELGLARERFVFRVRYRDRAVTLILREGWVTDEFIELTTRAVLSVDEQRELDAMKTEMAARVMSAAAQAVYDVERTE